MPQPAQVKKITITITTTTITVMIMMTKESESISMLQCTPVQLQFIYEKLNTLDY